MRHCRNILLTALLAFAMQAFAMTGARAQEVIASIRPVHSLVAMVMGDVGEAGLLLAGNESPHDTGLKPSQRRMIDRAELVFIIGPDFETFLTAPLAGRDGVVVLMETPGITLLARDGDNDAHDHDDEKHGHDDGHDDHDDEKHGHDDGHDDHDDEKHGHDDGHGHTGAYDTHIWMDPINAVAMLAPIADALTQRYPEHADAFAANTAAATARLLALHAEMRRQLAAVREQEAGIIVFHDAFGYFARRFDLNVLGSVLDSHGAALSAGRLRHIEEIMQGGGDRCIFTEPQFASPVAARLAERYGAGIAELDPLGADIAPGAELYPAMMRQNVAAITMACGGDRRR